MEIFAKRIKEEREKQKYSLAKVGRIIGCSSACVSYWENNKKDPTAEYIKALALLYNVSSDYLLGLEDEDGTKIESRKPEARNEALINNSFNHNSGNFNIDIKK